MHKSTGFFFMLPFIVFNLITNTNLLAQNPDTLFFEPFYDMDNWTPAGPQGLNNWSVTNTNIAGGNAGPELQFSWEYLFVGESYLLASPVFTGILEHNLELKFNYYEDWWSNIVYVGVAVTGDGGNTYNSIWELQAGGNSGPAQITVDFTGIDNMQVALYYLGDANDIDFWYVDDLTLIDLDAVPVELTSFTAASLNKSVVLKWTTATETNNKGFGIERTAGEISSKRNWKEIGFIDGNGTTTMESQYSFTDNEIEKGKYYYRLKQIDFDGSFEYSNIVEVQVNIPVEYSLEQNYPNPFNPSTIITFSLPVDSKVTLDIYDILGQKVKSLINGNLAAGNNKVTFSASGLNSGIYFYGIEAEGADGKKFSSVKKMILAK